MSKIVTANMLSTGAVVFLSADDQWVGIVDEARLFADADAAEEGLAIAQRDATRSLIVDPFVTDRNAPGEGKREMTLRDSIRAYGPTIAYQVSGRAGAA